MIFIWIKVETNHCKRCQLVFEEHKGYKGITHQPHSEQKHCFIVKKEHQHTGKLLQNGHMKGQHTKVWIILTVRLQGTKSRSFIPLEDSFPQLGVFTRCYVKTQTFWEAQLLYGKLLNVLGFPGRKHGTIGKC